VNRKALIIDDEDLIREVVKLTFELSGGWASCAASSGKEGIKLAAAESPDLILLDVMMPEMDGVQVLKVLQSNPATRSIPVIMLTANVTATTVEEMRTAGARGVIAKPFNPASLVEEVWRVAGG
jgi:two-component system, OmpR family, alkaline phosphatase synthesis response regulator PhoP